MGSLYRCNRNTLIDFVHAQLQLIPRRIRWIAKTIHPNTISTGSLHSNTISTGSPKRFIRTPFQLDRFILTPFQLDRFILTPFQLDRFILTPFQLDRFILTPFQLDRQNASFQHHFNFSHCTTLHMRQLSSESSSLLVTLTSEISTLSPPPVGYRIHLTHAYKIMLINYYYMCEHLILGIYRTVCSLKRVIDV